MGTLGRALLGLGLGLLGCRSAPPFPLVWTFDAQAELDSSTARPAAEVSPRTRRTETATYDGVTFSLVIDTADVEVAGVRAACPVRVEVTPVSVPAGLSVERRSVDKAPRLSGTPPVAMHRVEVAIVNTASGEETGRTMLVSRAAGPVTAAPLRPFGK